MTDISGTAATDAQAWLDRAVRADAGGDVAAAERAFLQALAHDPDLIDAQFGLGVTYFRSARYREASQALRAVATAGAADAAIYVLLGKSLYLVGQFAESAQAFETALATMPLQGDSLRCYARAWTYARMIAGNIPDALADFVSRAGSEAEPVDIVMRDGFGLLSAYGYRDAAAALGALLIATHPDDAVQRHLNDAVAGRAIDHVPSAYVEAHFDAFADGFDDKLVHLLAYHVPGHLADLVRRHRTRFDHILDVGCGTGLAGEHLRPLALRLSGVDLSARMLDQAARRQLYDTLDHAEALVYLAKHPAAFDLVFAADTLIYFGRLNALMDAVAQAMSPGGLFAASIENADRDFEILPSGRFAHAQAYVMRLADPHFELLERHAIDVRLEANAPAKGTLFVWRRRHV
jgi:predicted TPR repeat methyltransferase